MRVLILVVVLAAHAAAAEEREKVAVLSLEIEGDAPPELRKQLEKSLEGGLYAGGFDVLRRAECDRKLRATPDLLGCTSTTCLSRIGLIVGAARFVRARVEAAGGGYSAELELLDADTPGGVQARVERTCAVCTIAEANDMMSSAAAQLASGPGPAEVRVHVTSDPPGASVDIDGEPRGTTPFEVTLPAGDHQFRAALEGRQPALERAAVSLPEDGGSREILLRLAPAALTADRPAARYRVWKWAAAGAAAALLAAGIVHIAIDGEGTNCQGPEGTPCMDVYATMPTGVLFTGLGAAAAGVSGWMFWEDAR